MVAYRPGETGRLEPDLPKTCPVHPKSEDDYHVWLDHYRPRKTGPCHPLAVCRCSLCRSAFTLYPPGFVPYGRRSIVAVASDGSPLVREAEPPADHQPVRLPEVFEGTIFDAAQDAARGRKWAEISEQYDQAGQLQRLDWNPSSCPAELSPASRSTQKRWLLWGLHLLGLLTAQSARLRGLIAEALAINQLHLREQVEVAKGSWRAKGQAVCAVLSLIPLRADLHERMMACGTEAGLWGPVYFWQRRGQQLRLHPFRPGGTRDPPPRRSAARSSTSSNADGAEAQR